MEMWNIYTICLTWLLVNLLLYILIGAVVLYIWGLRNKRNVIKHMNEEDKIYLMRYYGIKDEKDLELPPSVAYCLFNGGSGKAKEFIEDYLVEGPHIDNAYSGMFKDAKLFEFGLLVVDPNNKKRLLAISDGGLQRYLLLFGLLILLGFTVLWALIPYISAATRHFEKINKYVANFGEREKFILRKNGKEDIISVIEGLKKFILN